MEKRKIITGLTILLVMAIVFSIGGSLALSRQAEADVECGEIEATQMASFTSPTTTAGTIQGDLEGTTGFTLLSTSPGPTPTTLAYTGTLVITTDDGTLTTFSTGIFTPGPNGPGTQFDTVTDGTGEFLGATGLLFFNFTFDATGLNFTSSVTGQLCLTDD